MIRVTAIASLSALLLLVLYLPAAHPPQRFLEHLRAEHEQLAAAWNPATADRVLARALGAHASAGQFAPAVTPADASSTTTLNSAVGDEMAAVNARLFNSPYFRSVDALLMLATYRLFALLAWLPWLAAFCLAAWIDAAVVRRTKTQQVAHHSPEAFGACTVGVVVLACGTLVALVLPTTLPGLLLPIIPICMAALVAGALRNFHARGH